MLDSRQLQERTVLELFRSLEASGLPYSILRNFEDFPRFGHDVDLVLATGCLDEWRQLAVRVANELGWDALSECSHWARSKTNAHRIQVFRFYRAEPLSFLQVDIFHAYLLWSLPLCDEIALLDGRIREPGSRFTYIDPNLEHLFHLFQIDKVKNLDARKTQRYIGKIKAFEQAHADTFLPMLEAYFPMLGVQAVDALKADDIRRFNRLIRAIKTRFLWSALKRNASNTLRSLAHRAGDYVRLFASHPCGFMLHVAVAPNAEKSSLNRALETLVAAGVLGGFTTANAAGKTLNWQERKIMERGGLVIKWRDALSAELIVADNFKHLEHQLLLLLIRRHPVLFEREAVLADATLDKSII